MPNKLIINQLDRITLVSKGRFTAKHPELREGVIEVVKAEGDWYDAFWQFVSSTPDDDIPEDWLDAFSHLVEKAKKNYGDGEGPFAGPHNSFPITSQARVYRAARLVGHAANPAQVKANIIRIAHAKGYTLPKSWQKKVKKSDLVDALKAMGDWLSGKDLELEDEVVKAKTPPHDHSHNHISTYGYTSYMHKHPHSNHMDDCDPDSPEHDMSETAHAHQHIAKAGVDMTPEEAVALEADNAGLKTDLDTAKTTIATHEARIQEVEKAKSESEATIAAHAAKIAELEKALAEKTEAVSKAEAKLLEAARQPLTAAPAEPITKAKPEITSDMKFDDALSMLLHS